MTARIDELDLRLKTAINQLNAIYRVLIDPHGIMNTEPYPKSDPQPRVPTSKSDLWC